MRKIGFKLLKTFIVLIVLIFMMFGCTESTTNNNETLSTPAFDLSTLICKEWKITKLGDTPTNDPDLYNIIFYKDGTGWYKEKGNSDVMFYYDILNQGSFEITNIAPDQLIEERIYYVKVSGSTMWWDGDNDFENGPPPLFELEPK